MITSSFAIFISQPLQVALPDFAYSMLKSFKAPDEEAPSVVSAPRFFPFFAGTTAALALATMNQI